MLTPVNRGAFGTLLDLFLDDDATPAEAAAIVYLSLGQGPRVVSRRNLREAASRYASAFLSRGLKPGDVVIVADPEILESSFAFWGAILMGAVPSMFPSVTERLDRDVYRSNMRALVQQSGARLVVTSEELRNSLGELLSSPVLSASELAKGGNEDLPRLRPAAEAVAFLQHSSGTTGLQKGVALSHQAVLNQVSAYSEALRLTRDDVVVSWLPLYHDMGLIAGFLLPLAQGLSLILMSPFEWVRRPSLLFKAIDTYRGTLCWLPNFAYSHSALRILDREIEGLSLASIRAFVNCSEPVTEASHEAFLSRFGPLGVERDQLQSCYAMAENTFAVTQSALGAEPRRDVVDRAALLRGKRAEPGPPGPGARVVVSCGVPIKGASIRIGESLPERRLGEIQLKSDSMLSGYHLRPDLDSKALDQGWFRTGDIGYIAGGELYVVGRLKDLIITAGKNIYPHDLETIVDSVPGVHPGRAVAFGVQDDKEGTELVAIVAESEKEERAEQRAIAGAIRRAVSSEAGVVVSYVRVVGPKWLLKTSSGKLARGANREKFLAELACTRGLD